MARRVMTDEDGHQAMTLQDDTQEVDRRCRGREHGKQSIDKDLLDDHCIVAVVMRRDERQERQALMLRRLRYSG